MTGNPAPLDAMRTAGLAALAARRSTAGRGSTGVVRCPRGHAHETERRESPATRPDSPPRCGRAWEYPPTSRLLLVLPDDQPGTGRCWTCKRRTTSHLAGRWPAGRPGETGRRARDACGRHVPPMAWRRLAGLMGPPGGAGWWLRMHAVRGLSCIRAASPGPGPAGMVAACPPGEAGWEKFTGGHISVEPRINERIRVPEVRLVGPNGEQVGIVALGDALRLAQESDLDLVEVAPTARPPVCQAHGLRQVQVRVRAQGQGVPQEPGPDGHQGDQAPAQDRPA